MYAGYELTINQPVKSLSICVILLKCLLIGFNSQGLILLRFMTLPSNKALTTLHLVVYERVIKVQFHDGETLFILFVEEETFSGKQLETDVMAEQFIGLEKRVDFLEIVVPEVALAHKIHTANVIVRQGE